MPTSVQNTKTVTEKGPMLIKPENISFSFQNVIDKLSNCNQKVKDVLRETLQENFRKGGFLRIFPSKNSNIYDKFLSN